MTAPTLTPIGGRRWRTIDTWRGHGVTIPAGFITDLASIPTAAEALLRMHRNELHWVVAGIVHDWWYQTHGVIRREADRQLRTIARAEGAPRWQAWIVWSAVRLFGWRRWRRRDRPQRPKCTPGQHVLTAPEPVLGGLHIARCGRCDQTLVVGPELEDT